MTNDTDRTVRVYYSENPIVLKTSPQKKCSGDPDIKFIEIPPKSYLNCSSVASLYLELFFDNNQFIACAYLNVDHSLYIGDRGILMLKKSGDISV